MLFEVTSLIFKNQRQALYEEIIVHQGGRGIFKCE